jgi:hypothetical protein
MYFLFAHCATREGLAVQEGYLMRDSMWSMEDSINARLRYRLTDRKNPDKPLLTSASPLR